MASISPCKKENYDIVIAGGGTAGCVLATRLSEVPGLEVLLLEAGGDHNHDPRVQIPALFGQAIGDHELDWDYHSVPQAELRGKEVLLPQGKGLGGSSHINLLGLVYPSKADYDAWSDLGNPGWDFNSMVPYLKKCQTFHMPNDKVAQDLNLHYIDRDAQGTDGPIQASYQQEVHPLDKAWIDTFANLGYPMDTDTMSGTSLGGYQIVSSIEPKKRERSHAGNAYLGLARSRPNLEILTDVIVDKVILSPDSKRALGVQIWHDGHVFSVLASRQVLLCAGAFGSPCILQRSGIGEPQHLTKLGIDVTVENDHVGRNLQDHIMSAVSFELKDGIETIDNFRDPNYVGAAMRQYETDHSGPLAGACVSFAYMPLLEQIKEHGTTEISDLIERHFGGESDNRHQSLIRSMLEDRSQASANLCMLLSQVHLENNAMKDMISFSNAGNYVSFFTALAHPLSRGQVRCTYSAVDARPHIDPAYYSHPLDSELMSRHVQMLDKIATTEPLKSMLKPAGRRIPEWSTFESLEEAERLMKHSCMSNYHPCGSCAMLPRKEGGVVDDKLKVYGVSGLRVCDSSIIPIIPRGNIVSSVYAIAEKGADLVKLGQ